MRAVVEGSAQHEHPLVRERAAQSIGRFPDPKPALLDLLKDEMRSVRLIANRSASLSGFPLPEGSGVQELEDYFDFQTDWPMTLLIKA